MSNKAERGTKRVCSNCSSKFYDLHRDPIVCPICQTVYHTGNAAVRPTAGGNALDADDDAVLDAGRGVEFVSLDEVAATEGEELPDIEGGDIADVGEDGDAVLDTAADEETFLETEDEAEADVTGFVANGSGEEDHER